MLDFQAQLKKAFLKHQSGEFDIAIQSYLNLLKIKPKDWQLHYLLGTAYIHIKKFSDAVRFFNKSIKINPNHAPTHNNLGNALKALNQFDKSLASYSRAISLNPDYAEAYFNQGNAYKDNAKYEEALRSYNKAIDLNSNNSHAYLQKHDILTKLARNKEALECISSIVQLQPSNYSAHLSQGILYRKLNQPHEALKAFQRAIQLNPNDAIAFNNLATAYYDLGEYSAALENFNAAINLDPSYQEALVNKSLVLISSREHEEALICCNDALKLDSKNPMIYNNLGVALKSLNRLEESISNFSKAIELNPEFAGALNNRGSALITLNRFQDALTDFMRANELIDNFAEAQHNQAVALQQLGRHDEAISSFKTAYSLNPNLNYLNGTIMHLQMHICDWSDFESSTNAAVNEIQLGKKISTPFGLLSLFDLPDIHLHASKSYLEASFPNPQKPNFNCLKNQKIRIGYFSADFYGHAMMQLLGDLFAKHDRDNFEIIAFSLGPVIKDAWRLRVETHFSKFIDCNNIADHEIAKLARELAIDIAIDLNGFTTNSRPGIFLHHPAPIIVNYLGFPGSMGGSHYDYIIADEVLIPKEYRKYYSEKVAYLPGTYQPNCRYQLVSDKQYSRKDFDLPENQFVFSSFNNNYKITPQVFETWINILKGVENSVLWLYAKNETAQKNLKRIATSSGIDADRLIFTKPIPSKDHFKRFLLSDLMLDTFPYGGHTTCSEALRMELPVVTMKGESFASRVAASLLTSVGLTDLITHTYDDYKNKAIFIAKTPEYLDDLKQRLGKNKLDSALFNPTFITRNIECLYKAIYDRHCQGLSPEHLWVP